MRNPTLRLLCLTAALGAAHCAAGTRPLNPRLQQIRPNQWLKLHQQRPGDTVNFRRQAHGGSCFDTKRGRLILFGSDTHGRGWLNSPLFFDPVTTTWTRAYTDDGRETYAVNEAGLPVAGAHGDHPWTMHTFGGVLYDPGRDEMVVVSHPAHMVPGRFTNSVRELWPQIKRHPTWTYRLNDGEWVPLPCEAESFFPYGAAWDSDRGVVIGYRPDGIYELGGEHRAWTRITGPGLFGWHNNCVYDSQHKALVVFGTNKLSNDIVVYRPATKEHCRTPTPGLRPPPDQHNPMAFEPRIGRTVVVVDLVLAPAGASQAERKAAKRQAEVWLYGFGTDTWQHVPSATLPFACEMNYNLEYDPDHRVLLLVTGDYRQPTTVWALRIEPAEPSR